MFMRIGFSNWSIIEKYFKMNFLSILSILLLKMTSWACFAGSELKFIFHWKAHLFIFCRSLIRLLAVFSGVLTVENKDVLSANNLGLHWRLSNKSIIYVRNKSGPNIESWETPVVSNQTLKFGNILWCLAFQFPVTHWQTFSNISLSSWI